MLVVVGLAIIVEITATVATAAVMTAIQASGDHPVVETTTLTTEVRVGVRAGAGAAVGITAVGLCATGICWIIVVSGTAPFLAGDLMEIFTLSISKLTSVAPDLATNFINS